MHDEDEEEILRQLSTPLRHETLKVMYDTLIDEIPMFSVLSDRNFRDSLLRCLHPILVSPNEVLMRQGESGEQMYLITQGMLDVEYRLSSSAYPPSAVRTPSPGSPPSEGEAGLQQPGGGTPSSSHSSKLLATLGAGDHVGEIALIESACFPEPLIAPFLPSVEDGGDGANDSAASSSSSREVQSVGKRWSSMSTSFSAQALAASASSGPFPLRTATVTAQEHCELFAVHRADFIGLCVAHPKAQAQVLALAVERLRRTAAVELEASKPLSTSSRGGRLKSKLREAMRKRYSQSSPQPSSSQPSSSQPSSPTFTCHNEPSADPSGLPAIAEPAASAASTRPAEVLVEEVGEAACPTSWPRVDAELSEAGAEASSLAGLPTSGVASSLVAAIEQAKEHNKQKIKKKAGGLPGRSKSRAGGAPQAGDGRGHGKMGVFGTVMSAARVVEVDDFLSPVGTTLPMGPMRPLSRSALPSGPLPSGPLPSGPLPSGPLPSGHHLPGMHHAAGHGLHGPAGHAAPALDPQQLAKTVAEAVVSALRNEIATEVRREMQRLQAQPTAPQ